ncbi:anaerobic dimethyl sulfoxide reductase subunit C (anchor subunit) [Buttiauxella sp. BIGb0471]|uniref:dimethyl sulfoxide reductase anchor subunit family protein n=1 Tax=Buttiauxella sp. BIGb0471 TaxID=2940597 RepID=UPI002166C604|nr:DmsC/YnfH family molybdoenzyme membrane anchor subunit [Buttiauxella sp. BIGb0471]MCS3601982.1 anaerobic dimethyl sulfoxide reductase subunit C (anchor subunit) [Buttiauxella sp. BIGb0471]
MHEWPLVIFTLLVQGSVGLTVFTTWALISASSTLNVKAKYSVGLPAMFVAFIVGALGLMASTAHLGYPLNAFHALTHFGSSWLSREIVFASLYLAVLGLATWIALLKKQVFTMLLLLASLLGLFDIACMSAIYLHASVVTWMHFNTFVMFFGTTLSLGAVACLWVFAIQTRLPMQAVRKFMVTAVLILFGVTLLRLLVQPLYMTYLATVSLSDVVTFPHQPLDAFKDQRVLRLAAWVTLVVGACLLALSLRSGGIRKALLVLGGGLVVVAEVLLRFSFFSIN